MDRVPPDASLELRGAPGSCQLVAAKPMLKNTRQGNLSVHNPTGYSLWITMYNGSIFGRGSIKTTACIKPKSSLWWTNSTKGRYVRGELTLDNNCQARVGCDTTIDADFSGRDDHEVAFYPKNWAPGGGCWWQWGS